MFYMFTYLPREVCNIKKILLLITFVRKQAYFLIIEFPFSCFIKKNIFLFFFLIGQNIVDYYWK